MVDIITPKRCEVYYNKSKLSLKEIKRRTGATHVLNGWVFNKKYVPCDWLVVDGNTISRSKYTDWALVSDGKVAKFSTDYNSKYVLTGSPLLYNGKDCVRELTSDVNRTTAHTAIGWRANGEIVLAAYNDNCSVSEVRNRLKKLNCIHGLLMDGGGSTSCEFPAGSVTTSRKVATVLLFWDSNPYVCPYQEPTTVIKRLSFGDGVRWVQWQLNRFGYTCTIDGIAGKDTIAKVKEFQKAHDLDDDGRVGPMTREALKK